MAENVRILLKEEEVDKRIAEVAAMINRDYAGKEVHLICILKGGVFFTCELAKRLTVPVSMDFMSVSSYGSGTESSGVVRIVKDLDESIAGKNVLIVEDIIDSGRCRLSPQSERPPVLQDIPLLPRRAPGYGIRQDSRFHIPHGPRR